VLDLHELTGDFQAMVGGSAKMAAQIGLSSFAFGAASTAQQN